MYNASRITFLSWLVGSIIKIKIYEELPKLQKKNMLKWHFIWFIELYWNSKSDFIERAYVHCKILTFLQVMKVFLRTALEF